MSEGQMMQNQSIRHLLRLPWNAARNAWHMMSGSPQVFHRERKDFLRKLPKKSVGLELGVFKGEYSEQILRIVQPRELHLVDMWWVAYGEYYPNWGKYTDFGQLKTRQAYDQVMNIVESHRGGREIIVHVGDDLTYLSTFPDGYFDWSYVDSSHEYEHTKNELAILKEKTKLGGLITGDDWNPDPNHIHHGVYRAVTEFCATYRWELFLLDNYAQWAIRRCRPHRD
jgi:hypothetical protein